ncbi:putative lipid II flippase FtsW [Frigoribacterium sp. CFBP 8759]|jgi:cell division protein FtsW|uniref:putative lipid II flippase FtsW n=1 Tax=Frigoribacterium TaxID=96492 RepID=UPI00177C565B|nr:MULTISPECIES: putative lipid II flippase FtsW [Frigoribacterium]MBD8139126.1 putative lipid II flippase FtsW [Frigoribacterium sp. CFBP 13605]MBD8485771.1 putative lipid II flippase FtsW [Frigoribacterium sp. CFBP 8759]
MANPPSSLPRRRPTESSRTRRGPVRPTEDASSGLGSSKRTAGAVVRVKKLFAAETGSYFVILGTTLFMVVLGLVMVLSSSSVEQYISSRHTSFFGAFIRQGTYAAVGIPLMLIVSRLPVSFLKRWAWHVLGATIVLQLLVFSPLGYEIGGNRNWIDLGSFTAQPSEAVKLALAIWLGMILSVKRDLLDDWKHLAIPLVPVAGVAIGLVVLGGDLGTTMIMLLLVFAAVWFAGVRLRYLLAPLAFLAVVVPLIAQGSSSRNSRIAAWLSGCSDSSQYQAECWQTLHGTWALASGGLFGVGLGNSKSKWSWLPEADNDFIFAIIGEELGLIGAMVVLALFIVLAVGFVKIIRRTNDPFVRVTTGAITAWIIGQALVNIAVVLGLLPVLGVPLPLISAGGSALIVTLVAIGVVLSFARVPEEPATPQGLPRQRVGSLR